MTRKSRRPLRTDDPGKPDHPPVGAALDRYEASILLMIASRVLEAYEGKDRLRPINLERRLRKSKSSMGQTQDDDGAA
jgi:hypothetical protein